MESAGQRRALADLLGAMASRLGPAGGDPFSSELEAVLGEIGRHYDAVRVVLWHHPDDASAKAADDAVGRAAEAQRTNGVPDRAGMVVGAEWIAVAESADHETGIVVPLLAGGAAIGVLGIDRGPGTDWDEVELAELAAVGALVVQTVRRLESMQWLRSAYLASPVGMAVLDPGGHVVTANESLARFLRVPRASLIGAHLDAHMSAVPTDDRRAAHQATDRLFRRGDGTETWGRLIGTPLRRNGDRELTFVQVEDVQDQRDARVQLEFEAQHDGLTGLVNRRILFSAVQVELDAGRRCALLLIDVDRFKTINDALGHPEGDRLLGVIAGRLKEAVRLGDVVCRLGGDEFAILLRSSATLEIATAAADRLLALAEQPVWLDGQPVGTSVSIGISVSHPESSIDALLREADAALYRAKDAGRNRWILFDDEMRVSVEARSRLEGELRVAVATRALVLHYQPEVSLVDGSVTGVEALVRWPHRVLGTLGADRFVELAEEVGLIDELGRWVIGEACLALARWTAHPDLRIAVNVSVVQLARDVLVDDIRRAITSAGIDPGRLVLEITETAVMRDLDQSMRVLAQLAELGVGLAIDDFGTGFSSLSHLKRLPVGTLKIDRSFVDDLVTDEDSRAIVTTILGLSRSLGLDVVAEGVTAEHQREILAELGCGRAQGHLFAPAMAEADVLTWIGARRS